MSPTGPAACEARKISSAPADALLAGGRLIAKNAASSSMYSGIGRVAREPFHFTRKT